MNIQKGRRAERQINTARAWWLRNRDKNPRAFDEDIEAALQLLADMPYAGKPVRIRAGMARRLTLERIRYYLFYRVERDHIQTAGPLAHLPPPAPLVTYNRADGAPSP